MVSPGGCAYMTTSARQTCFSVAAGKFQPQEPERRSRRCSSTETIRIRPFDNSLVHQNLVLVSRRSNLRGVVSQASNSRVAATAVSKQVATQGRSGKDPAKSRPQVVQIEKQSPKQSNKRSSSEASSTSTATGQGQVVKDGFAGLSGLKTQLEKARPRVSRVNVNDVGGAGQKQAEFQRKRKAIVHSKAPPRDIIETTTNPRSKEGQIRRGNSTLILVRNLAKQVTEEDYRWVMQSIPQIASWKYLSDKEGLCLGYSFCEVQAGADVTAVVQTLSEQVIHGKKLQASLSESSSEYNKQSLERQVTQTSWKKASSTSSSVQGRLGKGRPIVRNQAHLLDVSEVMSESVEGDDSTDIGTSSSQGLEELKNRNQYVDTEHQSTSRSPSATMDRDATDMGSRNIIWDSSQGVANDERKLTGTSVLEAFHRAAAVRESRAKPRRRKGQLVGGRSGSDSDSEAEDRSLQQDPLPAFIFKSEWATRIEELETDMKNLRQLL